MALKVWLPLNGSLENKGISNVTVTNNGATIDNNGKIGKCYLVNQSTNLSFPSFSFMEMKPSNNFSFFTWVKGTTTGWFIACGAWELRLCPTYIQIHAGPSGAYAARYTSTFDTNTWYHLGFTYQGDSGSLKLYLNGSEVANSIVSSSANFSIQSLLKLPYDGPRYLNDVRIYDHCLSPLEVKEISQGLILHYKLDGFSGGAGENILPNTTSEIRSYEYPSSSFKDQFAVITTKIPEAEKYTLSFYAKSTVAGDKIRAHYYSPNTTTTCVSSQGITKTASDGNIDFTLSTDWQLYWVTYTQTSTTAVKHIILPRMGAVGNTNGVVSGTGIVSIKCVKMEEGEQVTSWTPALSEMGTDTSKITDSSGYGNDGEITGTLETEQNNTEGRYQIATKFPTNSCYIKLPAITYSNFGLSYTFTWWEYMTTVSGGPMPWGFSNGNRLNCYHTTNLCWNTGDGGSNPFTPAKTAASLVDNKWHFMAITGDGTNVNLYVDGVYAAKATTWKPLTGTQIYISGWDAGTSYSMVGNKMSDFRIYATALSAEDIATLYHTPTQVDNLGGIHGFEFIEKTPNLLNPDLREWSKESNVTCVWNEETKYFDVNTNRDTSVTSRWGIFQNITVKPNTSYLFAVDMMGIGSAMGISAQDTTATWPSDRNIAGDTKRYYYILTTTATNTVGRVYLNTKPSTNQIAHFKNIYLGEIGEIASIKQNGIFENEDMVEYNENGRITKSGELAGSNFIEK